MVKIMSHREAARDLKIASGELAVICITDPGEAVDPAIVEHAESILHLEFHDVTELDADWLKLVTAEDIKAAIKFAKSSGDVVVCCSAGISRSSALAYVIECLQVHPAMAVNIWDKERHLPNKLVVKLGGEVLKNPNIEKYYEKWLNK